MKKSNFIVLGIAVVVSLVLLWLWWYLGFAQVDGPTDILITLAWWVVVGLVGYGIFRMEQRRRQQMRTVYVFPSALFNCESGLVECTNIALRVDLVEAIVKNMHYGFDFQDMPDASSFDCSFIIRTDEYQDAHNWKGSVVKVGRNGAHMEKAFDSRHTLAQALS